MWNSWPHILKTDTNRPTLSDLLERVFTQFHLKQNVAHSCIGFHLPLSCIEKLGVQGIEKTTCTQIVCIRNMDDDETDDDETDDDERGGFVRIAIVGPAIAVCVAHILCMRNYVMHLPKASASQ